MAKNYARKPKDGYSELRLSRAEVEAMEDLAKRETRGRRFTANPARAAMICDPEHGTARPMTEQERQKWT